MTKSNLLISYLDEQIKYWSGHFTTQIHGNVAEIYVRAYQDIKDKVTKGF